MAGFRPRRLAFGRASPRLATEEEASADLRERSGRHPQPLRASVLTAVALAGACERLLGPCSCGGVSRRGWRLTRVALKCDPG